MKAQFTLQRLFLMTTFFAIGLSFVAISWPHSAFLHILFGSSFFFGIATATLFVRRLTHERALKMVVLYFFGSLFFVSRWPSGAFPYLLFVSQFCFGASVGILFDRPLIFGFAFAATVWYIMVLWTALHPGGALRDFVTPHFRDRDRDCLIHEGDVPKRERYQL